MLKKMRWRFIGAAMAAFLAVILALLLAVNLWNYRIVTEREDRTLEMLQENDLRNPYGIDGLWVAVKGEWEFREKPFTTRFFTVRCDRRGSILSVYQEYIASVTKEDAVRYARAVLDGGRDSGYYQGFRYSAVDTARGRTVIFLSAEQELAAMRSLLLVSCAVAVGSAAAVFLLVLLFSRRAIAPYAKNIATQKRFITDASHEMKTPITAISASADVLSMELEGDEWVKNIQTQSARLSKLVTDLVTLSRLDEEQPFPDKTEFSLSDAVWEVSESMQALAQARGKQYSQDIEDGVTLRGDRNAVGQLVSVLLDNAIKYSDEGGSVRLELHRRQRRVELTVANTCHFVNADDLDRLFDRFYRPDDSRSRETGGTGLGLSIARATAEAHGGRIAAASPDGRSIVFTVTF